MFHVYMFKMILKFNFINFVNRKFISYSGKVYYSYAELAQPCLRQKFGHLSIFFANSFLDFRYIIYLIKYSNYLLFCKKFMIEGQLFFENNKMELPSAPIIEESRIRKIENFDIKDWVLRSPRKEVNQKLRKQVALQTYRLPTSNSNLTVFRNGA